LKRRNHGPRAAVSDAMKREPVTSSVVAAVGYDPRCQRLEVELKGGTLYRYRGVPANIHRAFMAALSKGSFYNLYVRDDYPFVRVR
jgi:hypothetical protein